MNNKRVTLPAGTRLHLATILLVEDDENVRVLVQTMLLQHGYRVLCAEDSDEALKIAHEQPHHLDLLIADMVMPGATFTTEAETAAGTELYQCCIHPWMRAVVVSS